MRLSNSNKALLITLFLSLSVVLMAFNVHIKKQNELVAETFFEILPDDEFFEETEALDDILQSLDEVLTTNKAFNETKQYDDYEDEDFKETMERLQNRHDNDDEIAKEEDFESIDSERDRSSFSDINEIIEKSSNNTANKNSTISFSLVDREKIYIPPPIYLCENGGIMVVNIAVNAVGEVTEATINSSSSSNNGCLVDHAIEYAMASRFTEDVSKSNQIGTITFVFRGKQ